MVKRLLFAASALFLAGCTASQTTRGPGGALLGARPAGGDPVMELDVCPFASPRVASVSGYKWGAVVRNYERAVIPAMVKAFKSKKSHSAPFRSIQNIKSLDDSRGIAAFGCDIAVEIGILNKKIAAWTYSARTKRQLFESVFTGVPVTGGDWGFKMREAVYNEFQKAPALLKQILAQRDAAAAEAAVASGGVSQEMLEKIVASAVARGKEEEKKPAAKTSDVDTPGYRRPERPHDFAVVVGIEKYSEIAPAAYGERDAAAVVKHFEALGVPRRNIVHLPGVKATRTGLLKYLNAWLPKNVTPKSRVYFFYSGHGAPDPESGEAYLVPFDGDPNFLADTALPLKKLYASLSGLPAKEIVVALDACFSGAGGRSVLARGARPLVMRVRGAAPVSSKIILLTAASGSEITTTIEEQGHGIFTYYFLKGLQGEAKDRRGRVTAAGLYDYLKPKVQDEARRQNRDQTPGLVGHSKRDLLLR
ncbi:MAG: caspase family protein [Elusimicrobiota bacterium]